MTVISPQMQIAIAEAGIYLDEMPEAATVEDRLKVAMRQTKNHWLCTDQDEQFRAAVGAVMLFYGPGSDEFKTLEVEMLNLRKLGAMLEASQAGLIVETPEIDESPTGKIIGVLKLWKEMEV